MTLICLLWIGCVLSLGVGSVKDADYPACDQSWDSTDCCRADQLSILCVGRCPLGFFISSVACGSFDNHTAGVDASAVATKLPTPQPSTTTLSSTTVPSTTTLSSTTVPSTTTLSSTTVPSTTTLSSTTVPSTTAVPIVTCCACHEDCLSCSGPGRSKCSTPDADSSNVLTVLIVALICASFALLLIGLVAIRIRRRKRFGRAALNAFPLNEFSDDHSRLRRGPWTQKAGGIPKPLFCDAWQEWDEVTSHGGSFTHPGSDIRLDIPAQAVEEGASVTVSKTVCTDLDLVHREFHLPQDGFIMSPMVEYHAGQNFRFQKPVLLALPYFLPPTFSQNKVKVYRCYRSESGQWTVETVQQHQKDNLQSARQNLDHTGSFCFAENKEIHISTTHFSIYFCTDCGKVYPPPDLFMDVYAMSKMKQYGGRVANVRLDIWDSRVYIEDFKKDLSDRRFENFRGMSPVDFKQLPALAPDMLDRCQLKARLDLDAAPDWSHSMRGDEPIYPPESMLDLMVFIPCTCRTRIPHRVDWQLTAPAEETTPDAQCYVDVGYVTEDDAYVRTPKKVTVIVNIENHLATPRTENGSTKSSSRRSSVTYLNLADVYETVPKQLASSQWKCASRSEEKNEEMREEATTMHHPSAQPAVYIKYFSGNLGNISSASQPPEQPSVQRTQSLAGGVVRSLQEEGLSDRSDRHGETPRSVDSAVAPQHCDQPTSRRATEDNTGNARRRAGDSRHTGAIPKRGHSEAYQPRIPFQPGTLASNIYAVPVDPSVHGENSLYLGVEGATSPHYWEEHEVPQSSPTRPPAVTAPEAQNGEGASRSSDSVLPLPVPVSDENKDFEDDGYDYLSLREFWRKQRHQL